MNYQHQDDLGSQRPPIYDSAPDPPDYGSFEAANAVSKTGLFSRRDSSRSKTLRRALVEDLDDIIESRLGSPQQPELKQAFEIWKHQLLLRLDGTIITPDEHVSTRNRGFNYYYEPNWTSIAAYFKKLLERRNWRGNLVSRFSNCRYSMLC